jgi:hypothetical protein
MTSANKPIFLEPLDEAASPFSVRIDSDPFECEGSMQMANLTTAQLVNGYYQCRDSDIQIVNGKKCNLISKSPTCEKLRIAHKKFHTDIGIGLPDTAKLLFDQLLDCHWEASLRYKHRAICACVADEGHMTRIDNLVSRCRKICNTFVTLYKVKTFSGGYSIFIPWLDSQIVYDQNEFAGILYASRNLKIKREIRAPIEASLHMFMQNIWGIGAKQIKENGRLTFRGIQNFGWLEDEFSKESRLEQEVHKSIQAHLIAGPVFEELENCIVYSSGDIIGVHFDREKVAKNIRKEMDISIHVRFLQELFENRPLGIYRNCLEVLRRNNKSDLMKLCDMLPHLHEDVQAAMLDNCEANDPGGIVGEEIAKSDAVATRRTWANLVRRTGAKTTDNILQDISNMNLTQAKKFMDLVMKMFQNKLKKQRTSELKYAMA